MNTPTRRPYRAPYTAAEDALLVQHYNTDGPAKLLSLLGRTRQSIKMRAKRLGLFCGPRIFTSESARAAALKRVYPPRKPRPVREKPYEMMSPEREALLVQWWALQARKDTAALIGLSISGLARHAKRLGLGRAGCLLPKPERVPKERLPRARKVKPAPAPKPVKVAAPKPVKVLKAKPVKPLPVAKKKTNKELEPLAGLAAQLRVLPFTDPLRQAYLQATRPGTKAGQAPRTMAQLRALLPR